MEQTSKMKCLRTFVIHFILAILIVAFIYGWAIPVSGVTGRPQNLNWSLVFELVGMLLIWVVLAVITSRFYAASWMTLMLYLCFIVINLVKITFLDAPLMPVDFLQLDDLIRTTSVVLEYLPYFLIVMISLVTMVFFLLKREKPTPKLRYYALCLLVISSSLIYWQSINIKSYLATEKLLILKNTNLVNRFTRHGYLNFFIQAIFFQTKSVKPEGYSQAQVEQITKQYALFNSPYSLSSEAIPDNIIFILAESFVDPNEFGWETSEVVLKHFNRLRENHITGKVVVPVFGGKSINTEFELLTGLSMFFTPIESLPFRELVPDHTPSIARVLKHWGFESSVIQVVHLSGFGFEKIYDFIGINKKFALTGEDIIKDPSGRFASSQEMVKKITSITATQKKSFIYSFANSSHMPWLIEDYPENSIQLNHNHGLNKPEQDKILAYFNALRHVETLLTDLIDYYTKSDEKTLILFVGDHHPSLDLIYDGEIENMEKYVVPALIWSNYLPKQEQYNNFFISMNYLAAMTLNVAGMEPNGFFKFNSEMMDSINLLSSKYPLPKNLSATQKQWLKDYEALQYHILMDQSEKKLY